MRHTLPSVVAAPSRGKPRFCVALALAAALLAVQPAFAQLRPVVIREATVLTGDGRTIENGGVAFQSGQITEIGRDLEASFLAQKIPGRGKYVTPGLIDIYSTLGLRDRLGGGSPTAKAVDAFDYYASDELRAAWRCGVTVVYLPARTSNGVGGLGAVMRLLPPRSSGDAVLAEEAALNIAVDASGRQGPLSRVRTVEGMRQLLRSAKEYRETCENYEEDLKEYEKKVAERAAKKAEAEKKEQSEGGAAKKGADEEEKEGEEKKDADEEAEKDELEKPTEPDRNPAAQILLRALDGEIRVRIEVHHPADILNILDLAEEYSLALVLEGATSAHLVADRLAKADVPVVLFAEPAPLAYDPGAGRYERPDAAAALSRAGVKVYLGTGPLSDTTAEPRLTLAAARAVGDGLSTDAAFATIAWGAARLLGIADRAGLLAPGRAADIVIWSDHPLAPGARVERVFLDGQEVYNAEKDEEGLRP